MNKVGNPTLPFVENRELRSLIEKLNRFHNELVSAMEQGSDGYLWPVTAVDTNYIVNQNDALVVADASSAVLTVTLAAADVSETKRVIVKRVNASNNVLVSSLDLIDGQTTRTLGTQYEVMDLLSDGDTWHKL